MLQNVFYYSYHDITQVIVGKLGFINRNRTLLFRFYFIIIEYQSIHIWAL